MGNLEKSLKREIRLGKIQRIVLGTVAAAGLLSVAMVAPNALQALKIFGGKDFLKRNGRDSVNYSRKRLVQLGLLEYNKNGFLRLTNQGQKELSKAQRMNYKATKPAKWDGKWRVIIFDIKEEKRCLRDKVRNTLVSIGFICLQKSVWIYPYDCEDLINLIKADFKIGRDVLYMIVDRVENDELIRESFGLENKNR